MSDNSKIECGNHHARINTNNNEGDSCTVINIKLLIVCNWNSIFVPAVPENPGFLEGYPFNSTTIHIFWKSIPPSLRKEQLLGYRIQYRRLGSQLYSDLNVTNNITETVIGRLDFQTSYEVKVNGFNENGHGEPGNILVVKTLQEGKYNSTDYSKLCLGRQAFMYCWFTQSLRHKNKNGHHSINQVKNLRDKRRKIWKQFCKDLGIYGLSCAKILGEMI